MIKKSEILNSEKNNMNSTLNAIQQAIHIENQLQETVQSFIDTVEVILKQEEDNVEKKDLKKLRRQTSFMSMYSEMYFLFSQKKENFSQWMQQIKNDIHQTIYDTMQDESVASRKDIQYHDIVMKKSSTEFKFIKQEEYVLFNENHIFRKLRQMTEIIRKRFNKCDSKKYSLKKVDSNQF